MKPLVLDSSALLTLLFDEPGAETMEAIMHRAAAKEQPMLMTGVNWAEVCYRAGKRLGPAALAHAGEFATNTPITIVAVDRELAEAAATYKAADRLGLADAFAAALAKSRKAELVTADREFKSVESEIKITWLK